MQTFNELPSLAFLKTEAKKSYLDAGLPNLRFHNPLITVGRAGADAIYSNEEFEASGIGRDGTGWGKLKLLSPQIDEIAEVRPHFFDKNEVNRRATDRLEAALTAKRGGAEVDKRMLSEKWQRRQVKKEMLQDIDLFSHAKKMVGGSVGREFPVIVPGLIKARAMQKKGWLQYGERTLLINEKTGKEILMSDVMIAAEKNRNNESYTMLKGIQNQAEADGLSFGMLTLSAPPRFHPNPSMGQNSWDGSSPKDAHKWLSDAWRGVQRRLLKKGITVSGVRFTEFHKDGCPHWHIIFYTTAFDLLVNEVRKVWPTDAAADFKIGDPGKGSFANYCFGYVFGAGKDGKIPEHVAQYDAKRAVWQQRKMQFFGIPNIGMWRAIRKLKNQPEDELLAGAWLAARRGDAGAFIGLAGGLAVGAKHRPLKGKVWKREGEDVKKATATNKVTGEFSEEVLDNWEMCKKIEIPSNPTAAQVVGGVAVIDKYPRTPNSNSEKGQEIGYCHWEPPKNPFDPPKKWEYQKFKPAPMSAADQAFCKEFVRRWKELYPEQCQ
jgi:hypothetical protein